MDVPSQPDQDASEIGPQANVDRLLGHLRDDSLAAALVRAARDTEQDQSPTEAIKAVVQECLEQAKVPRGAAKD